MRIIKKREFLAGIAATILTLSGIAYADWDDHGMRWTSLGTSGLARAGYEDNIERSYSYLTMPSNGCTYANVFYSASADTGGGNFWFARLQARIRACGSDERIKVYLKERRLDTGLTFIRLYMDSDAFPSSSGPRIITDEVASPGWSFEAANSVFFVEVRMYKSASSDAPRLYDLTMTGNPFFE